MAFWTDPTTEPKRAYRWFMLIGGIPQWLLKKTGKPAWTVSKTTHKYINHSFHYPGKVEWQPLSVTLADPVAPDASATMQAILFESGYHAPEDANDISTISKSKAISALGRVVIAQIGADAGDVVEEWELVNAWISDAKFGELDYDSDEMTNVEIELTYDYAKLITSGVPATIDVSDNQ